MPAIVQRFTENLPKNAGTQPFPRIMKTLHPMRRRALPVPCACAYRLEDGVS
jgi:hypothetical protein